MAQHNASTQPPGPDDARAAAADHVFSEVEADSWAARTLATPEARAILRRRDRLPQVGK
jgi:hypothetical protein